MSKSADMRQLADRLESLAAHRGCHGWHDVDCVQATDEMAHWCGYCCVGRAARVIMGITDEQEKDRRDLADARAALMEIAGLPHQCCSDPDETCAIVARKALERI